MKLELEETTIQEKIKRIAAFRGYTLTELGSEFNRRYGTKYNPNSFFRKLRSGAIRYDELKKLGEILNFNLEFNIEE